MSVVLISIAATGGVAVGMQSAPGADSTYEGKAISFIAFCSEDGVGSARTGGDNIVSIENIMEDEDGEVDAVSYNVMRELGSITYKAGQSTYVIEDPPTIGSVTGNEGTETGRAPSNFCPSGESGVKFEGYNELFDGEFAEVETGG